MSFLKTFEEEFAPKLDTGAYKRAEGFRKMFQFLEAASQNNHIVIVETGTARRLNAWSDGQSTFLWDKFLRTCTGEIYSIDLDPKASELSQAHTKHVNYLVGDSVEHLNYLSAVSRASLVYLDSYDLDINKPQESALHHLMELTAIYGRLPRGCLIAVDDCPSDTCGKHMLVKKFFDKLKIPPHFKGYQCGWIKPV